MENLINTSLGQYQLIEIIGKGGMSTIYKAYQASLDRYVAVKVLARTSDPQFMLRFKREARAIAQLQHPNILPIYDYGEQDGLLYLVLQYIVHGATLHNLLGAPVEPARALRLASRVLEALDYAHNRGIIHRDTKPANILLAAPDWPMLADFGIAKLRDDQQKLTVPGLIIGTAAYMAPEQASGRAIDARTDLYAMGVVLYQLLTGRVPFDAETPMALATKHIYESPLPPRSIVPSLPAAVEAVAMRALAKDPNARYQSAAEMGAECEQLAAQIEQSRATRQLANLYQAGVRAFETGEFDLAAMRLEELIALEPTHANAAKLLESVRAAQRQRSTLHQPTGGPLVSPPERESVMRGAAPAAGHERTRTVGAGTGGELAQTTPEAAAGVPESGPAPGSAAEIGIPPASPEAPAPVWQRWRAPLIAVGALVILAVALLPLLRSSQSGGTSSTAVLPATAAAPAPTTAALEQTEPSGVATAAAPAPTDAATPRPTEALSEPAGTVVFADTYGPGADQSGLLGQYAPSSLTLGVDDALGVFFMQLSQPNQTHGRLLPRGAMADFSMQIDLAAGSSDVAAGAAQGVVFSARDTKQFYALLIDPRGGRYTVRKYNAQNEATDLIPWKESDLVRSGAAVNQLRLDAVGDTFTIYLNGTRLDSVRDSAYRFGMIGMVVESAETPAPVMHFDNLKVWSADAPPPLSELPATRPGQSGSGDMVLIRGGEFIMGSNDDPDHLPHIVELPDFYIDRTEVTNLAYLTCADAYGCTLSMSDSATRAGYLTAQAFLYYPVLNVTWQHAHEFCENVGKRLPSEAEWERAASWNAATRTKSIWPWGNVFDRSRLNSAESNRSDTTQGGQFPPEQNNTVDMAGNVAEWTSSLDRPYPYTSDDRENAQAPGNRVVRGGSWSQSKDETTATARQAVDPATTSPTIGFRCAANP